MEIDDNTMAFDAVSIGAGAAGLSAAAVLKEQELSVRILEASSEGFGGRMHTKTTKWSNFSIDIGGEWIHVDPSSILPEIAVGRVHLPIPETIPHDFGDLAIYDGEEFYYESVGSNCDYLGWKWVNSTWWYFFNDHVASSVRDDIVLGCVVQSIDYSNKPAVVTCQNGDIHMQRYELRAPPYLWYLIFEYLLFEFLNLNRETLQWQKPIKKSFYLNSDQRNTINSTS
jgi:hypothetical protein